RRPAALQRRHETQAPGGADHPRRGDGGPPAEPGRRGGAPKKLTDLARWWASGGREVNGQRRSVMDVGRMIEQYRAMGATEADIARAGLTEQDEIAREGITVLAPNWPALRLFMACSHQWHTVISPVGRLIKTGLR